MKENNTGSTNEMTCEERAFRQKQEQAEHADDDADASSEEHEHPEEPFTGVDERGIPVTEPYDRPRGPQDVF
jgi:hypothetical protein